MRLDSDAIHDLSKGFSYDLEHLSLDHNKIGDSGIEKLADQFYKGEGNHTKDPWRTNTQIFNPNWKIKTLSLKENELRDAGVKHLKKMVQNL